MILIKYRLKTDGLDQIIKLPFDEFYDPLSDKENYQDDGVERYFDYRDYVAVNNTEISSIQVTTPAYVNIISYGEKGSITQHTVYSGGDEMMVIQSKIETDVIHSVKLRKGSNGDWVSTDIELIYEKTAKIVSLN